VEILAARRGHSGGGTGGNGNQLSHGGCLPVFDEGSLYTARSLRRCHHDHWRPRRGLKCWYLDNDIGGIIHFIVYEHLNFDDNGFSRIESGSIAARPNSVPGQLDESCIRDFSGTMEHRLGVPVLISSSDWSFIPDFG
jgi:hypothetical protein